MENTKKRVCIFSFFERTGYVDDYVIVRND